MKLERVRSLQGPNVWAACPVLEVVVDLGGGRTWVAGLLRKILERLGPPSLDPDLAQMFGEAVLRLQEMAGQEVSFTAARPADRPGLFVVAVEYAEENVGRAAAEIAARSLRAAGDGESVCWDEELRRLRDLAYDRRLPATAAAVYRAARARGIPAARLCPEYGRFLRLGQGSKQHRCHAAEPDTASAVARHVSTDKHLAKYLLQAAGVPVPQGRLVSTAEEAWAAACELGPPVAVKPHDSDLATGVSLDLRSREQVEAGFRIAREHSSAVLVERFAPGLEHRVLVVGERVVAVTRIEPPHVLGDGVSTVAGLVERVNQDPRRGGEGSGAPLKKIVLDETARAVLAAQGLALDSVPAAGARVLLRRNPPYIMNGGNLVDVTDQIHPSTAAHAVAAAQAVQLPVAGLDVVALDIGRPLEEQGGVVVEINTSPGLWLHLAPWADSPRPVGEAIVAALFPPGSDGRIPVVAVVGPSPGPATRHLAALLGRAGLHVGVAGAEAIAVGARRWAASPGQSPRERADILMQNTTVDVAVLETTARELVHSGFGNDQCDIALVLHPAEDGDSGASLCVLRHALARGGDLILPAGEGPPGEASVPPHRITLIAAAPDLPGVRRHLTAGGRALVVQGHTLVLAQGGLKPELLGPLPAGQDERDRYGLLAAVAASVDLGLPWEIVTAYLGSLPPGDSPSSRANASG